MEDTYFSHDGLREFLEDDEYSEEQIEKILQKTENILIFWCENQGIWNAGIKKEDLPMLAHQAIDDVCTAGNPRNVTEQDILVLMMIYTLGKKSLRI